MRKNGSGFRGRFLLDLSSFVLKVSKTQIKLNRFSHGSAQKRHSLLHARISASRPPSDQRDKADNKGQWSETMRHMFKAAIIAFGVTGALAAAAPAGAQPYDPYDGSYGGYDQS